MHTLQWSDDLSLDLPLMNDTYREFVGLLAGAAGHATLTPFQNATRPRTISASGLGSA